MHIKQRFASEAKESAALKQQRPSSSKPGVADLSKPIVIDGQTVYYDELKRRYNTLNEIELRELIAKLQQDEKNKEAGGASANSSSSVLPSESASASENRPAYDRSLKPGGQKLQNRYNLRTVSQSNLLTCVII